MRPLKNWDNKTWLSSEKYISNFHKFLKTKTLLNKNTKILDIGCGRANIISFLQKKYRFKNMAIGVDILRNKNTKKNILFKKSNAINFLREGRKFDLILIKQTIHFFSKNKLILLLNFAKKSLNPKGKILIFSLKTKNNKIPCFKKMKHQLNKSLKKDEFLFKVIRKNLKKINESNFNYEVNISKNKYINMIKNRYISCLLNLTKKEINKGIGEIKFKYKNQIKFTDTLKCISFRK
ncbi:MAG: class I SAM-dependent methyltransferase [Pelagibacteraceae bacterium]|jgi:ubiquinone/menaquinone biosynthesis C-methylase UbiE|tara:strand:+ start:4559 stop:5266 length:708 start_codon:yes stop_codon:yes gene_type:complete